MKILLFVAVLQALLLQAFAPPVTKKEKPDEESLDPFDWTNNMEYKQYLMEVLTELEKDKDFQKRLEQVKDHNDTRSVADQLQFASHSVRTRLDEIKRREVARLNELETQKERLENPDKRDGRSHIDHLNPDTFEAKDLHRLINKVAGDLVQVDTKQEEEFKQYEMDKEIQRKKKLTSIKDKKLREAEKQKMEESKIRHKKHEKLHHPGSEEQLKDVWEKEDHLDRDQFDPKTFFALHDKDNNGHLDEEETEALMMRELDKVYEEGNPDDDMMERYHEMMKMRQEVMKEVDRNNDRMISYQEFKEWTKKREFKEDPSWKTTEESEKPPYSEEEFQKFAESYRKEHPDENFEDIDEHEDSKPDSRHKQVKEMHQQEDSHALKVGETKGQKLAEAQRKSDKL